jgi:hypothetical protein
VQIPRIRRKAAPAVYRPSLNNLNYNDILNEGILKEDETESVKMAALSL